MTVEKLKDFFEFSLFEKNRTNGLCKLCRRNYKDQHGIYSNFVKHLKRKHPVDYEKSFSIHKDNNDDDSIFEGINSTNDQQASMDFTLMNSKQNRVNYSIAKNLIIKCNLPLSLIENSAFREFIKECYSKWQPISTRRLKANIICSINKRIHEKICETLQKIDSLTLTIDTWSDRRGRGFLGITCHFIDDRMIPQAFLIDFIRLKSPHTSVNIQRSTEYVLDSFNIKEKVYRIITDNASVMIKAYKFGLFVTDDNNDDNEEDDDDGADDNESILDNSNSNGK